MNTPINIFDRNIKRIHRDRSAKLLSDHDFLIKEIYQRTEELLTENIVKEFPKILNLGTRFGELSDFLEKRPGTKKVINCDLSSRMLEKVDGCKLIADDELLPFANESFDLIISTLNLHWINDLPGSLVQIRNCLKKDGLFIASTFGGESLTELRQAILAAEADSGISPRISPFVEVKDAGSLLQRTGFSLPVTDSDTITVMYKDAYSLMFDLRGMGETNALIKRRKSLTSKKTMENIAQKYNNLFAEDEKIPATFEVITMTGWKN